MQRRDFLMGMIAAPMAFISRDQSLPAVGHYSMVLGPTDANNFQISVVHKKTESLRYFVRLNSNAAIYPAAQSQTRQRDDSDWAVTNVVFASLPDFASASILVEDDRGQFKDERPFRWLNSNLSSARVAVASCAAGYLYNSEIWLRLNESSPDLVIFLGDNIYGDRPNLVTKRPADPRQLWAQYVDGRLKYDYYFRSELIPTIATWDDHDFGLDDGDRTYKYAAESQEIFNSFWPQQAGISANFERGPGITSALRAFGMEFILLDSRSERTSPRESEVSPTSWGAAQLDWLKQKIKSSNQPLWLGNGQQFFGSIGEKDSLEFDYPLDFEWLIATLRGRQRPVAFLSGDVHYSEVMDIEERMLGFSTIEITSSSLHSVTFPGQHNLRKNPRRRTATSRHNFIILNLKVKDGGGGVQGQAICIGASGEVAFSESIQFGP